MSTDKIRPIRLRQKGRSFGLIGCPTIEFLLKGRTRVLIDLSREETIYTWGSTPQRSLGNSETRSKLGRDKSEADVWRYPCRSRSYLLTLFPLPITDWVAMLTRWRLSNSYKSLSALPTVLVTYLVYIESLFFHRSINTRVLPIDNQSRSTIWSQSSKCHILITRIEQLNNVIECSSCCYLTNTYIWVIIVTAT